MNLYSSFSILLKRLKSDTEYINRIKEEFIFGSYKDMIIGDSIV